MIEWGISRYRGWKVEFYLLIGPRPDWQPGEWAYRLVFFCGYSVYERRWNWWNFRCWPAWLDVPSVRAEYERTMR